MVYLYVHAYTNTVILDQNYFIYLDLTEDNFFKDSVIQFPENTLDPL